MLLIGKSSINGPFSMAVLNNQRVYDVIYVIISQTIYIYMLESRMTMNNPCLITEMLNWLYLKMSEYI